MKKVVLSLAFVVIGSFTMAQEAKQTPSPEQKAAWEAKRADAEKMRAQRMEQHLQEMKKDLNLTDAQVAQIKSLQDKHAAERRENMAKMRDMRQEKMEEMKAKKQQHDSDMKKILTPEQYEKWQAKRAEKMEERRDQFEMKKGDRMQRKRMGKEMRMAEPADVAPEKSK